MGRPFILDQSIGHPVSKGRIYDTLRLRFPEWSDTIARKSAEHVEEERREHDVADRIIVPSRFVAGTLIENGFNGKNRSQSVWNRYRCISSPGTT